MEPEAGVDIGDAAVPGDRAPSDDRGHGGGGHRLGKRRELEDGVGIDRLGRAKGADAEAVKVDHLVLVDDCDRHAGHDAAVGQFARIGFDPRQRRLDLLHRQGIGSRRGHRRRDDHGRGGNRGGVQDGDGLHEAPRSTALFRRDGHRSASGRPRFRFRPIRSAAFRPAGQWRVAGIRVRVGDGRRNGGRHSGFRDRTAAPEPAKSSSTIWPALPSGPMANTAEDMTPGTSGEKT